MKRSEVEAWRARRTVRAPFDYEMLSSCFFDWVASGGKGGHLEFMRLLGTLEGVQVGMTEDGATIGGLRLIEEREP